MSITTPTHREVVDATAATEATMVPQRVPVNVYATDFFFSCSTPAELIAAMRRASTMS